MGESRSRATMGPPSRTCWDIMGGRIMSVADGTSTIWGIFRGLTGYSLLSWGKQVILPV